MIPTWTLDNIYDPVIWVGDLRLMGEHWFQITPDQEIKIQITKGVNSYLIFRFENHLEPGKPEIRWKDQIGVGEKIFKEKYGDGNGVIFYFKHFQIGDYISTFKPEYITTFGVLKLHLNYRAQMLKEGILFNVQIFGEDKNHKGENSAA